MVFVRLGMLAHDIEILGKRMDTEEKWREIHHGHLFDIIRDQELLIKAQQVRIEQQDGRIERQDLKLENQERREGLTTIYVL